VTDETVWLNKAMPETNANRVIRLMREADATEQRGRHLLNIAVLLVDGRHHDKAVLDAKSLFAEAAALREHAARLAPEGQT
jgi:hypothetical protein